MTSNKNQDYRSLYREKLTSARQAVSVVRSGDWIDYGWCINTPQLLDQALAERYQELTDVKLRGGVLLRRPAVTSVPEAPRHFIWNSWHMTGVERKILADGGAFYCPMRYSELPRLYLETLSPIRAAFVQTTPMDREGWFHFGPGVSHLPQVCQRAEYVFVEVNRNLPCCPAKGVGGVHISQVAGVVEGQNPSLGQLSAGQPTETDCQIARRVVGEIPNGACLQLGIGTMPSAVGHMIAQSDLKDLGVHTELYVDAFAEIARTGKMTGQHKGIDHGLQIYTFAAGSQGLYDYLEHNPICRAACVDYTNNASVIAQLDNFISINSAVHVDLFGQVNAESVGTCHISGAGGQLDFLLGAYLSKGGKSFICLPATFTGPDGQMQSRILPTLPPGSIVTDTRPVVQYLVTEYGMVNLKGTSTWERAERIISIAHPDAREDLICQAEKMGIWRRTNR